MAREIDELVLKMDFDNAAFKQAAAETLTTLKNLENSLDGVKMKNVGKEANRAFSSISRSADTVDLGNIERQLERTHNQFSVLGTVGRSALFKLTDTAMTAGRKIFNGLVGPLTQGGFTRAMNIEQAEFMLKGLGANVEEITTAAMNAVKGTAYGFDEAAKAASQFYASGLTDAGEMEQALLGISGVAAMTGSSYEDIASIFTTVSGQGRIMTHQLHQFASRGLNVAADLAKSYGVSEEALRQMVTEGKVSFSDFQKAMSEAYGEHAKKAADTFSGALSMPKSALSRIGADFARPMMDGLRDVFNALAPLIDRVHEALGPLIDRFSGFFGSVTGKVSGWMNNLADSMGSDKGFSDSPILKVVDAFKLLGTIVTETTHTIGTFVKSLGLGNALDGLRKLSLPDLDFKKYIEGIREIGQAFRDAINNGEKLPWNKLFEPIKKFGSNIKDWISEIDWNSVGRTIGENIVKGLEFAADLGKGLMDLIMSAVESVDWGKLWESILNGLKGFVEGASDLIEGIFDGIFGNEPEVIEAKVEVDTSELQNTTIDGDIKVNENSKSIFGKLREGLSEAIQGIETLLGEGASRIGEGMKKLLGAVSPDTLINAVGVVLGGVGIFQAAKSFRGVTDSFKGFGDALKAIPEAISGTITKVGEAFQKLSNVAMVEARGNFILKLGVSVGIMAASLYALARLDLADLAKGVAALGTTLGVLYLFATKMAGVEITKGLGMSLMGLALGLWSISHAIDSLGSLDLPTLAKGLGAVALVLAGLFVFMKSLTKIGGKTGLFGVAMQMMALALGVNMLTNSIVKLSGMSWKEFLDGFSRLAIVLAGLWLAMQVFQNNPGVGKIAGILTLLGASLWILHRAISAFADMDWGDFANGIVRVAVVLAGLFVVMKVFQKVSTGVGTFAGSLLLIAGGLFILYAAITQFANMDWETFGTGITRVAVSLGLLWLALKFFQGPGLLQVGGALLLVSVGLWAINRSVQAMADLSFEKMMQGLLGVGLALTGLVVAANLLNPGKMMGAAGAMLLIAIALRQITASVEAFAALEPERLFLSLLAVAAALGILIGALFALTMIGPGSLKSIATLMGLAAVMFVLAAAMRTMENVSWGAVGKGLALLAGGLTALLVAAAVSGIPLVAAGLVALSGSIITIAGGLLIGAAAMWVASKAFENFVNAIQDLGGAVASLGDGLSHFADTGGVDALQKLVKIDVPMGGIMNLGRLFRILKNHVTEGLGENLSNAADGLKELKDVIPVLEDLAGMEIPMGGAKSLNNLLNAFTKLTPDTGPAIESFVKGIKKLDDAQDTLNNLRILGKNVGVGEAKSLGNLFSAFDGITPETGNNIRSFASAIEPLAEQEDALNNLRILGKNVGIGEANSLSNLFSAFNDVPSGMGENIRSFASAIETLAAQEDALNNLRILGKNVGIGEANSLANLFSAFNDVPSGMGENIRTFASAIETLAAQEDGLNNLRILGKNVGIGEANSLSNLFSAFNEIPSGMGENLRAFASSIQTLADKEDALNNLRILGKNVGLGEANSLSNLFSAFDDIKPETGNNLRAFASSIQTLADKEDALNNLRILGKNVGLGEANSLSNLFSAFDDIKPETGNNIRSFASSIQALADKKDALNNLRILGKNVGNGEATSLGNLFSAFNSINPDVGANIESLASSIHLLADALPALENIDIDVDGLTEIGTKLGEALGTNLSDAISNAADAVGNAVSSLADAAGGKESDFKSKGDEAGKSFGDGVKSGIEDRKDPVKSAGGSLGQAASTGARSKRGGMVSAGKYLADGMAAGIRQGMSGVREAAASLAQAAVESAKANLKIESPSRVFMEIGRFTSEGLALGIDQNAPMAVDSVVDMLDEAIKMTGIKQLELSEAQKSFAKQLARDLTTDHVGKRLNRLATHSRAVYATMIRDRRIEQEEEAERLEDEKIKAYEDVENARDRLTDMDEREREQARENKEDDRSAKRKELDESKARRDREKAERDYQRAVAAKNRYEYRMHGEEAGVAFINGVAFGMIQESDAVPTFHHVFSEVLYEELETLEKKADEAFKAFKEPGNILDNVTSIADEFENMSRSIGRAGRAASDRGWARNMRDVYDSMVNILSTSLGIFDSLKVLEPYLPAMLQGADRELAKFMPMIEQNIPQLAPILGNGLINALGTIAGPVAGAVAIVAAIIIDGLTDGGIRKGLDNFKDRLLAWLTDLPSRIVGWMVKIVSNLPDIFLWLVEFVADVAIGLIHMITELIATSPKLLVDLVLAVAMALVKLITQLPGLLVEVLFALGEALITGLIPGIFKAVINLIPQMLRLGWELITGLINGVISGARRLWDAIVNPIRNAINTIKRLFGIEVKDDFEDIGKQMAEGMSDGMEDGEDRINRQFREMMQRMQRDSSGIDTTIYVGLDTTELDKSLDRIRGNVPVTLNQGVYTPAFTAMRAAENAQTVQNVTNIEYNQTVQTPQEMRTIDVYRASRRGLTEVTGVAVYA